MKLRYITLSTLFVCGAILSVDMNTSYAAKDNVSDVKPVLNSEYGEVVGSGKFKGGMEYTVYRNSEGYRTAVYGSGYVGNVNTSSINPYNVPDADHHLFTGELLDESLERLFYKVQTQKITMNKTPNLKDARSMFDSSTALEIDVSKMTTNGVTDMGYMFKSSKAQYLDVSNLDTSNVTNMWGMFKESQVQYLDVSNWDTSNVRMMTQMFSDSEVQQLDVSNWDTSKVTEMSHMFNKSQVQHLDVSNWDTSNVAKMNYMFNKSQVQHLDVSNWDTSKVTEMNNMFANSQVQYLDVSNWDTSHLWFGPNGMFQNSQIKTITYGPKFGTLDGTDLPAPSTDDGYTGEWIQLDSQGAIGDPSSQDKFLTYIPDTIQTWTWQRVDNNYDDILNLPKAQSQGMLTFKQNTEVVDPSNPNVLDPTKPNIPIEKPENGSGGSGFKNFYINYVTDFNFNDITITGGDMEHFADPIKMDAKLFAPFVQVTDNRGIVDGWKLEVVPSSFKNGENELKGAELVITGGVIIGNNGQSDEFKPQMRSSLKLIPGSITSVMSAEQGKGYGTWSLNFTDQEDGSFSNTSGVKAVIPVSALPKVGVTYTADFTWTLSATPD